MKDRILKLFPALSSPQYRLFFYGQLISLTGIWLQQVAQGWLVLQLTQSAFLVGLVSALSMLPVLFFSLFGGLIVDRFSTKRVMLVTQLLSMILAIILGLLTVFGLINIYLIAILAFLLGIISSVNAPARQSFVSELVEKEQLSSAIALNSGVFNAARIVGPALAGIAIALIGAGGAFILNGLSYIATLLALALIKTKPYTSKMHSNPFKAIQEGLHYAFTHKTIGIYLIYTGTVAIFGWSYITIMPVIVQDTFKLGAAELGSFYSAAGFGSLIGIVLVSGISKRFNPSRFIFTGCLIFVVFMTLFSFTTNYLLALLLLVFTGIGITMQMSMVNSIIQHSADHNVRGRVMSIFTLMTMGMSPLGSIQMGFISQHFGTSSALRLSAVFLLIVGSFVYYRRRS